MSDRLLLHVCCGPCSMHPLSVLVNEYGADNITGLFYNPNIHPKEEFSKRRENALIAADHYGINLVTSDDLMLDKWRKYGPVENKLRCMMCYDLRLEYAAKYAASNGYNAFSTTLLVSPWQDHQYIIDKCNALAEKYGIRFHYEDYRTGYRQGQEMAKAIDLYRQKFCGCMWSAPAAIRESIILP
ncbi:MAG: epoxyqueuosine reductase QueH [Clostridia bacterium]|nr:epoxyqueuosine reductase QueH [Clostridia bacterium]